MPGLEDEIERIIAACIDRHSKGDPAALVRAVLEELWEAGYDVTRRPEMTVSEKTSGSASIVKLMSPSTLRWNPVARTGHRLR
jgi:hypothetical protein